MKQILRSPFFYAQIALVVLWLISVNLLPGVDFAAFFYLLAIWLVTLFVAYKFHIANRSTLWALLAFMTVVSGCYLLNINFFFSHDGASPSNPCLINVDALRNWNRIIRPPGPMVDWATYPELMRIPSMVMNLDGLVAINALMTMLTLTICARLSRTLCGPSPIVSTLGVIVPGLVFNFLCSSSIFIKDAAVCFSFAAVALGLVQLREGRKHKFWIWLVFTSLALILLIWVRSRAAFLIFPLILLLAPWRKNLRFRELVPTAFLCLLVIIVSVIEMHLFEVAELTKESFEFAHTDIFHTTPRGSVLEELIATYPTFPLWKKIALLPFSMALQLFTPLPWTYMRHVDYGPALALAHMGFFWYIEAGIVIYFIFKNVFSAKTNRGLTLLTLYSVALYMAVAFMFCGSVSRYTLPCVPLIAPCVVYVLQNCHKEKSFKYWMFIYSVCVFVALAIGWYFYSLSPAGNDRFC